MYRISPPVNCSAFLSGLTVSSLEPHPLILDRGDSAHVPDLPGYVASGDTREEIGHLIRETIELYREAVEANGKPIPKSES